MKYLITVFTILFAISIPTIVQSNDFDPTVVILLPDNVILEDNVRLEIDSLTRQIKSAVHENYITNIKKGLQNNLPANYKLIYENDLKFYQSEKFDYFYTVTSFIEQYMQYNFMQGFENMLVYAIPIKLSYDNFSFHQIADSLDVRYIVNIDKIELSDAKGYKLSSVTLQLYDNASQKIVFSKSTSGYSKNPGGFFACSDGSIDCTIKNAISKSIQDLMMVIYNSNSQIIKEKTLTNNRSTTLEQLFASEPVPTIPIIIQKADSNIDIRGYYQGFMNTDKNKFVSFYLLEKDKSQMKSYDSNNFKGSIVAGVFDNDKWHVEQSRVTIFNADSKEKAKFKYFNKLQQLGYHKKNSTEINQDFWETNLFAKVPDVTKDPDYEKYYKSYYRDAEIKNKSYIGMYKIVAQSIQQKIKQQGEQFEIKLHSEIIIPLHNKLKNDDIIKFNLIRKKPTLIYPKDHSVVLHPLSITHKDSSKVLRYYVIIPGDSSIYKWTYFQETELILTNSQFSSVLINQLSTLSSWNFSFDTLDDMVFWKNYVLKKENGAYKYLHKVK